MTKVDQTQRVPSAEVGDCDERPGTSQPSISRAESLILELADFIYVHSALKPMSKVLFFMSRLLLTLTRKGGQRLESRADIGRAYRDVAITVGMSDEADVHEFDRILRECEPHLPMVLAMLKEVRELAHGTDALGLLFNTLLRGKFEAGEGLGTYLTPEEVVTPMVRMAAASLGPEAAKGLSGSEGASLLFGDIAGGTGRFAYAMVDDLARRFHLSPADVSRRCRVFDQSRLSLDLGRINFLLENLSHDGFEHVEDSLVSARVSALRGRFGLLATNPPFGVGKYRASHRLRQEFSPRVLDVLGLDAEDTRSDPSEVFLARNLDLLAPGGVLAIVLPDGVAYSERTRRCLREIERASGTRLEILAAVSLPVATFALGGTVAKTSFLIIRKDPPADHREVAVFAAVASHVGFLKRGNARIPDPAGNDLAAISREFCSGRGERGLWTVPWRQVRSHSPSWLLHHSRNGSGQDRAVQAGDMASLVREFSAPGAATGSRPLPHYHISVLDVDETGLIDLRSVRANRPVSRVQLCKPGDVLVSCINPKIWRVTLVPDTPPAEWSCSQEFAVLRPNPRRNAWPLFVGLLKGDGRASILAKARGTSSSRQRVEKTSVLDIPMPGGRRYQAILRTLARTRSCIYRARMRELAVLDQGDNGH
ncbi:MAG: SAM-dependent DNA methyltransferase [Planctomycetes bacterium]|nr:SAM-dependent DNA methyltransferase [Planctomycetota bacterium]